MSRQACKLGQDLFYIVPILSFLYTGWAIKTWPFLEVFSLARSQALFGGLGATYIGKRVVDFLLVLIELFC